MQTSELADLARRQGALWRDLEQARRDVAVLEQQYAELAELIAQTREREQQWQQREAVVEEVMEGHVRNLRVPPVPPSPRHAPVNEAWPR